MSVLITLVATFCINHGNNIIACHTDLKEYESQSIADGMVAANNHLSDVLGGISNKAGMFYSDSSISMPHLVPAMKRRMEETGKMDGNTQTFFEH